MLGACQLVYFVTGGGAEFWSKTQALTAVPLQANLPSLLVDKEGELVGYVPGLAAGPPGVAFAAMLRLRKRALSVVTLLALVPPFQEGLTVPHARI